MKKLKLGLSLAAVILGAGLSFLSAGPAQATGKFTTSWFAYSGSGSPTDPANYVQVSGTPSCPSGTSSVCEIQATVGTGMKPVINSSLSTEINADLSSHQPSGNVKLRDF